MSGDTPTHDEERRFRLWRALTETARAQPEGRLTDDQLATLQAMAVQLQELAHLAERLVALSQDYLCALDDAPPSRAQQDPASPSP